MLTCIPEHMKVVQALPPTVNTGALVGDYVSLKTCHRCFILVNIVQGHATQPVITIEQATTVAMAGSTAITVAVPIWSNLDCATTDTLVARTAAVSYTLDVGLANKLVIFQVDPSTLNVNGGFDCIGVKIGASNILNIISAVYLLTDLRYAQATPISAILD
jgi:hypothetical protein